MAALTMDMMQAKMQMQSQPPPQPPSETAAS
jgi:hypothetical protein